MYDEKRVTIFFKQSTLFESTLTTSGELFAVVSCVIKFAVLTTYNLELSHL